MCFFYGRGGVDSQYFLLYCVDSQPGYPTIGKMVRMMGIKQTRDALMKAGVTQEKAAKMTSKQLIEAAEGAVPTLATDHNDVVAAEKFLK